MLIKLLSRILFFGVAAMCWLHLLVIIAPVKQQQNPKAQTKASQPIYCSPDTWTALPVWTRDGKLIALPDSPSPLAACIDGVDYRSVLPIYKDDWTDHLKMHRTLILDAHTYQLAPTQIAETLYHPKWSIDGKYIAGSTDKARVVIFDADTGKLCCTQSFDQPFPTTTAAVSWSPNANRLALACSNGVAIWDPVNGGPVNYLTNLITPFKKQFWTWPDANWLTEASGIQNMEVASLAWHPDGSQLAVSSRNCYLKTKTQLTLTIYDVTSGKILLERRSSSSFGKVGWSYDGKYFAYGNQDVHIIDAKTQKELFSLKTNDLPEEVTFEWANNSHSLAYKGFDRALHIWDADKGGDLRIIPADKAGLYNYKWSPKDRYLTIASIQWCTIYDATMGRYAAATKIGYKTQSQWLPDESALLLQDPDRHTFGKFSNLTFLKPDSSCLAKENVDLNPWICQQVPHSIEEAVDMVSGIISPELEYQLRMRQGKPTRYFRWSYYADARPLILYFGLEHKSPLVDAMQEFGVDESGMMAELMLRLYWSRLHDESTSIKEHLSLLRSQT